MFDYDMQRAEHFNTRFDAISSYEDWCKRVGVDCENFPFKVNSGRQFKGRELTYNIRTWGSYLNADGQWVVFIAYYSAPMKHTTQYSWSIDSDGRAIGVARKYEFIAG